MNLTLPEGYVLPENVQPGQEFDAVVTLLAGNDGTAKIVAIDGSPVDKAEDETELPEDTPPPQTEGSDFVNAVMAEY